jgi:hypothetical protein
MTKARGDGYRHYVIYSDPMQPLDSRGWPIEQAFDALLVQCEYAAIWEVKQTAVLNFRHLSGPNKNIPVGVLTPVDHPRTFSAEIMRGNCGEELARKHVMVEVLRAGLNGWRGETRDTFSLIRNLAEQRLRNPERFPPKSD